MRRTDAQLDTGGAKIKAVHVDGLGRFIAMTETGVVLADDFRTALPRVRNRAPLEFRHPMIRRLDEDRFLVVNARTRGDHNGRLFDLHGKEMASFYFGDAIEDIVVFRDKIVVTYFDEGVFGNNGPNNSGLTIFSFDGEQLYGYNDQIESMETESMPFICDCYAASQNGPNRLVFFSDSSFRLSELNMDDFSVTSKAVPDVLNGANSISTYHGDVIFHSPYHKKWHFFWLDAQSNDVEELPDSFETYTVGIGNGKFLVKQDFGYTILEPLETAP